MSFWCKIKNAIQYKKTVLHAVDVENNVKKLCKKCDVNNEKDILTV